MEILKKSLDILTNECYTRANDAGWWNDYHELDEKSKILWVATKLCLVHSEVSESLEGLRKGVNDDHLSHRPMFEVELADALIRILDLAGGLGLDLSGAFVEKLEYNANRADHKLENRAKEGGKTF